LSLALLGILSGCGENSGKPAVVKARGKVLFNRTTPAAGALVVFHPADPDTEKRIGGKPHALAKQDRRFSVTTHAPEHVGREGECGVSVEWHGRVNEPRFKLGEGEGKAVGRPLLNPKYGNPRQPALKAIVRTGQPNEFKFEVD